MKDKMCDENLFKIAIDNSDDFANSTGNFFSGMKYMQKLISENTKQDFNLSARPLIKFLAENNHPHTMAIVTSTGAELFEGMKATGEILDYLID